MIVEPAPTTPRSPLRRGLRVAGMVLPVVALVAIVAAGVLGPQPEPETQQPAPSHATAVDDPAIDGRPETVSADEEGFPRAWIGLRVRSVTDTLALRAAGPVAGIVAVAGYLTYGSLAWQCVDAYLDVDRAACDGRATLVDSPTAVVAPDGGSGGIGPHLHPQFPAGTRGPAPDDGDGSPRSEPIAVVLLGSFDDPRASMCGDPGPRCDEAFVVERVVWVAGAPWGPTLTVDPAIRVEPNIPEIHASVDEATDALGNGSLALATAVVLPDALATIDPAAAAALPPITEAERLRPVTYVRGLVFQFDASQPLYGRDPAVEWVVLGSISGDVLARGEKSRTASAGEAATP